MSASTLPLLDQPMAIQAMFHPRRETSGGIGPGLTVRIPVGGGLHTGGRLYCQDPQAPLILYFHGNGEIAADYDELGPIYNQVGATLLVVDFRGYGISDGTPTGSALMADAQAAWDHLPRLEEQENLQPAQRLVMGRSMGSAAALAVAERAGASLDGLIIESGFAFTLDLLERLGCPPLGAYSEGDGFRTLEKISRVTAPTLIIHGAQDWIIPPGDGQALAESCPAPRKGLLLIPNAGHNDLMMVGFQAYFQAIRDLMYPRD
ncbi:MAG: alpha/beta fold hydrolase [Magnetococcales bacterium]|nr:alpha/beta fold hydrolase [Magnetococcales bacterium]